MSQSQTFAVGYTPAAVTWLRPLRSGKGIALKFGGAGPLFIEPGILH